MDATLITIKRKAILSVIEYCLDNKIEFTVKEKSFGHDEFELKLIINDIKKALAFGYYARENKIDLPGLAEAPVAPKAPKAPKAAKVAEAAPAEEIKSETTENDSQESESEVPDENANAMLF